MQLTVSKSVSCFLLCTYVNKIDGVFQIMCEYRKIPSQQY